MTLSQFFTAVSQNPWPAVIYFIFLPAAAWALGELATFTYVPFSVLLIGFVLTLLAIRFAWSKLF